MTRTELFAKVAKVKAAKNILCESVSDETALEAKEAFPFWDGTTIYSVGDRVQDAGTLYKRIQPQTATEIYAPHEAPALWVEVGFTTYREIKENMLSTEAFALNEIGWWETEDNLYRSLMEGNTYTPVVAPAMWVKI